MERFWEAWKRVIVPWALAISGASVWLAFSWALCPDRRAISLGAIGYLLIALMLALNKNTRSHQAAVRAAAVDDQRLTLPPLSKYMILAGMGAGFVLTAITEHYYGDDPDVMPNAIRLVVAAYPIHLAAHLIYFSCQWQWGDLQADKHE